MVDSAANESKSVPIERVIAFIDDAMDGERMEEGFIAMANCARNMLARARERDEDYAYQSFTAFAATMSPAFELGERD